VEIRRRDIKTILELREIGRQLPRPGVQIKSERFSAGQTEAGPIEAEKIRSGHSQGQTVAALTYD
jgi:hypothetical protein